MTRIDILSGFLGAGKTTLILEMLKSPPQGQRIVICENEYGEVGIDGETLRGSGVEVLEINAGCVCCTLSGNLITGLKLLIAQHHPDRIILEPTGLASLPEILSILRDDGLEKVTSIGTPAAVLDGSAFTRIYEAYQKYFDAQLGSAAVAFVNRTGSLDDEGRLALMEIVERVNPKIRVVAEPFGAADIWEALDAPPDTPDAAVQRLPKSWLASFGQLSIVTDWSGSKERLESFVMARPPFGDVIRVKGFVRDIGGARFRAELSGGVWSYTREDGGGAVRLQFIGRNLAVNLIKQFFSDQSQSSLQ